MDTFDQSLEEARDSGTLEHLLVTQTSLPVILGGLGDLSFCFHDAAHRGLRRLGRVALRLSAARRELARRRCRSPRHLARLFWPRHSLRKLRSAFQARQSREVVSAGHFQRRGRHALPDQRPAGLAAVRGRLNPVTYALDAMRAALLGDASLRPFGGRS